MPSEVVCAPARANVADAFTAIMEQGGAAFKLTAADARWQLGKREVHGGWFTGLDKASCRASPQIPCRKNGLVCQRCTLYKNQLIQVYGMTPSQFVFGKNPVFRETCWMNPWRLRPQRYLCTSQLWPNKWLSAKLPVELR